MPFRWSASSASATFFAAELVVAVGHGVEQPAPPAAELPGGGGRPESAESAATSAVHLGQAGGEVKPSAGTPWASSSSRAARASESPT